MSNMLTIAPVMALIIVLSSGSLPAMSDVTSANPSLDFHNYVGETGDIQLPVEFRARFVHLGSFFVPEEQGAAGAGLHDVYTQAAAVEAYRKTGEFPDGTVLVKEVRKVESAPMTTGKAHWGTEVVVWFVMVRDRENRFPDHPNFGGGWGWALFEGNEPDRNVAESWKGQGFSNCHGCHLPAEATDWVYVQGYPTLR